MILGKEKGINVARHKICKESKTLHLMIQYSFTSESDGVLKGLVSPVWVKKSFSPFFAQYMQAISFFV